MDARINMVMTGAKDIATLRRFYEDGLGWAPWLPPTSASALYEVGTAVLVFLDADYLARESGVPASASPKSFWAIFVDSKEEVDMLFARAGAAGAVVTSAVRERDGDIYSGYFADPEGNGWEVVYSPHMLPRGPGGALAMTGQ